MESTLKTKHHGKAMTYADKYALMKAYKIMTGDDPDQNKSPDRAEYDRKISSTKVQALEKAINEKKIPSDKVNETLKKFGYKAISDITMANAKAVYDELIKEG